MRVSVAAVIALACQHAHANPPSVAASAPLEQPPSTPPVQLQVAPPPVQTDSGLVPASAPAQPRVDSYRGSMIVGDGVALGMIAVGAATDFDIGIILGVPTYVVRAPIMHMSRQRYGRAAASLAMRVGLPLVGVVVGDRVDASCGSPPCMGDELRNVYVGLLGGVVLASVLDAAFLASGDAPERQSQSGWTPTARPTQGGLALGVTGYF